MTAPFLILGHRGARNKTHFQNSLSAFREALDAADGFETDTAISADGVIYLAHDITNVPHVRYMLCDVLDERSAAHIGERRLDQMTAAEIDILRLKNGEPLPKLADVLTLFRGRVDAVFNIELKSDNTAAPVVDLVRQAIAKGEITAGQIIMSSFNFPAMAWIREHAPEFKRGALFALEHQEHAAIYPWGENRQSCYVPFSAKTFDTPELRAIDPDFFNLALPTMSITNIAAIQAAYPKARFIAWGLGEPTEAEAPHVLAMLTDLAKRDLLHAWITDEPRLRKQMLETCTVG